MEQNKLQINKEVIAEDEIDLSELFKVIWRSKKFIFIFVSIFIILALIYVLKLPNTYTSKAVLVPVEKSGPNLGALGGLASAAGIGLSGGGSMTPDIAFNSLLNDYSFMEKFVRENAVDNYYLSENIDKNYVFALGYRGIYDFFKSSSSRDIEKNDNIYGVVKKVQGSFSILSDKQSGLISVSYDALDRYYPPKIIKAFLNDASRYLVENNLENIDKKLQYYQDELSKADSFELKVSISRMISKLIEEKTIIRSKNYFQSDLLLPATVKHAKDKTKPKRALIIIVSMVTSIILAIFIILLREFLRGSFKH